jgi:hypothetical protein
MEIKAAWRQITDPSLYGRYVMVDACVPTADGVVTSAALGLVGFHIMHKLPQALRWVWATFEQIDNVPTQGGSHTPPSDAGFSFWGPTCTPTSIPAQCGAAPGATRPSCDGGLPAYALDAYLDGGAACGPYPIEVDRLTPIQSQTATLNSAMQDLIRKSNPSSVLQYYQLVDIMWWSCSPVCDGMTGGTPIPLPVDTLQPDRLVANTTLETYEQNTKCLDCHQNGAVPSGDGGAGSCGTGPCAADFSFIFREARVPQDAGFQPMSLLPRAPH